MLLRICIHWYLYIYNAFNDLINCIHSLDDEQISSYISINNLKQPRVELNSIDKPAFVTYSDRLAAFRLGSVLAFLGDDLGKSEVIFINTLYLIADNLVNDANMPMGRNVIFKTLWVFQSAFWSYHQELMLIFRQQIK
jgi:hypothetical protein